MAVYHQQIGGLDSILNDLPAAVHEHEQSLAIDRQRLTKAKGSPDEPTIRRAVMTDLAWLGEARLGLAEQSKPDERVRLLRDAKTALEESLSIAMSLDIDNSNRPQDKMVVGEVRGLLSRCDAAVHAGPTRSAGPSTGP